MKTKRILMCPVSSLRIPLAAKWVVIVAVVASFASHDLLRAAQTTWTGGSSTTSDFNDVDNWSNGVPVSAVDNQITFAGSTNLNPNNNFATPYTVNSITFASGAGVFTLGGNALSFGGTTPAITNNSSNLQTINNNVSFGVNTTIAGTSGLLFGGTVSIAADKQFTNNSTAIVTLGNVALSGRGIINGTGTTVVNGVVSSGFINLGSGTLTLNGNNSGLTGVVTTLNGNAYSESMRVSGGTLNIGNDHALGSGVVNFNSSGTIAASGGSRSVANNIVASAASAMTLTVAGTNHLTLGGTITRDATGTGNLTIIVNNLGTTTFTGNYNIAAPSGNASRTGAAVFSGSGEIVYDGIIQNGNGLAQGLTYSGSGSGSLRLTANNTYTGTTTLNSGTLIINSDANLNGVNSALAFNGGTLQIEGTSLTSLNAGRSTSFGTGGQIGFNIVNAANKFTVSQNLNMGSNGILNKYGAGTLILSGNNTYSKNTIVNAGTLQIAKVAALHGGVTTNWTQSQINVKSGATLALNVGGAGEFTAGNVTTLLTNLAVSASTAYGLTAGSNIGFDTTNAGGAFTVSDVIANTTGGGGGALGVAKLGSGNLVLTNVSTYTGDTKVTAGRLIVNGSLSGSNVTVENDATLGGTGGVAKDVTVNLGGRIAPGANGADSNLGAVGGVLSLATDGTLTLNDVHIDFDLAATAAGLSDKILTGELTLGSSIAFTFNELTAGVLETGAKYTLMSATGINGFDVDNITTSYVGQEYIATYSVDGNSLEVEFAVVPEPNTMVMLLCGLGVVVCGRNLRQRIG